MTAPASERERFRKLLSNVFSDNTREEAIAMWRGLAELSSRNARSDIALLDAVLADPPPDLPALMEHDGWIHLSWDKDEYTVVEGTYDEYLAWLRDVTESFRAIAAALPDS